MKKFYSKFLALLCTLMMAAGSAFAQEGIELPFSFTTSSGGTVDGVGFYMWSADWVSSAELYGEGDANATWGTINLTSPAKNIVKVELTCRTNGWSGVSSAAAAAATVVETEDLGGSITTSGDVAIWQGSAPSLTFSSTDDIDVYKMVVYLEEGEAVKECTVDVDHYADNCKPGKYETPFTRYITLYMQQIAATGTWTGSDNCPADVTLTNEEGQQFTISQFNTWVNSEQIGIVFAEEITTPGTYTLHIPEGLVPFQNGNWNKEINVTWTVVAPDLRTKVNTVFDFTTAEYETEVLVNYEAAMTTAKIGLNTDFNYYEEGKCITAKNGTITFTAPDYTSIVKVTLSNGSNETNVNLTADGECEVVTGNPLTWTGNASSVTLTTSATRNYVTSAVVTLAIDDEEAFKANFLTGIDTVLSTEASNKVYDLIGRRVVNAQNGLFIVNGKKVIR